MKQKQDWKSALTDIIEQLTKYQCEKLLHMLEIPNSQREKRKREEVPQLILEHYGEEGSISEINSAMEKIPRRDPGVQNLLRPFVDKLDKENKGTKRKRVVDPVKEEKSSTAGKKRKCGSEPVKVKKGPKAVKTTKKKDVTGSVKGTKSSAAAQKENCSTIMGSSQPWRKTIDDLKSSGQLLDKDAITGKVVQISGLRTYETKDKVEKPFFYLAVADETGSIKVMVYGKERYQYFMEGQSYMFRNIIIDGIGVKVSRLSKVSKTNAVPVPEEIEMEAQNLIGPEMPVRSIAEVLTSADKTIVSVEGTVTEIDSPERVKVRTSEKKIKRQDLRLKDDTGSIRVCMWGEDTKQCKGICADDVIRVSNVSFKRFFDSPSLSSTGSTRIHKVQSVGIRKVRIKIRGIITANKKTTHLEAEINDRLQSLVVDSQPLAKAFGLQLDADFNKELVGKVPLLATAEIEGSKINKITTEI